MTVLPENSTFAKTRLALLMICTAAIFSAGCSSNSQERKKVYKVKGKVTMSGAPVVNALVTYSPTDKQPVAMGRTNDAGEFSLTTYTTGDGAALGKYVVLVSKEGGGSSTTSAGGHDPSKLFDSKAAHSAAKKSTGSGASGSLLPEKYASVKDTPLSAEVTDQVDKNNFTHELKP